MSEVVASYIYCNELAEPLARIDRIEPGFDGAGKSFLPYLWDASKGRYDAKPGLNGLKLPLYHLDEARAAAADTQTIFFVEGEGKGDRLRAALRENGSSAAVTTIAGGANAYLSEGHIAALAGAKRLCFLADSDIPGDGAATERAHAVAGAYPQCDVRIIDLFPDRSDGSDVADWLGEGHTIAELGWLVEDSRRVQQSPTAGETTARAAGNDHQRPSLNVLDLRSVRIEPVTWLMTDRLPLAEVTIVEGDGGIGKTTVMLDIAARLSRGSSMPDGTLTEAAMTLIIAEEDRRSILKARLLAANADLTRVRLIDGAGENDAFFTLPTHCELLRETILTVGAKLVIIDALFSHFSDDVNAYRPQDVRRAFRPLVDVAHDTGAAIAGIRHWTKAAASAKDRGLGSVDLRNIVRSVLTIAEHPDEEGRYVAAVSKSNLGRPCSALTYHLESAAVQEADEQIEVARVQWGELASITANELANRMAPVVEDGSDRAAVDDWLASYLVAEMATREILSAGKLEGFSRSSLYRGAKRLGVTFVKATFGGCSTWAPPPIVSQSFQSSRSPALETDETIDETNRNESDNASLALCGPSILLTTNALALRDHMLGGAVGRCFVNGAPTQNDIPGAPGFVRTSEA